MHFDVNHNLTYSPLGIVKDTRIYLAIRYFNELTWS